MTSDDAVERVARALCRYTWEREFAGKNLDAYVEVHWKAHAAAARVALAAQQDGVRETGALALARFMEPQFYYTRETGPDDECYCVHCEFGRETSRHVAEERAAAILAFLRDPEQGRASSGKMAD